MGLLSRIFALAMEIPESSFSVPDISVAFAY